MNKSAEKSQKLKEANKQQNFNTGIKDFDFWLSEVKTNDKIIKTSRCKNLITFMKGSHPPHNSQKLKMLIFGLS